MSTMVGEETEHVVTGDNADRGYKEIKKTGSINAFFHPVKTKQDTKPRSGNETSLNTNKESGQATESNTCASKSKTAIVQEPEALCSVSSGDGQTSKTKTSNLSGKDKSYHALFQEDLVKPKQPKSKWSVTCAVRNSLKSLNSSGSDFEDDGKSAFDIKTIQVQKSGKKKAKNGSRNNSRNAQENEGNASESTDNGDKESEALNIMESNLSKHVIEKHVGQLSEKAKSHNESKALEKCEKPNQMRTSAFDVLMKSQRAQKLEDQRTETLLVDASDTALTASDSKSEISGSCELIDSKGALQSKLSASSGDSSSETNAFDFLMRKGRLGKSPTSMDSQLEPDLECKVLENQDCSSKQKSKKKSFEFKLSIRASKRKDTEFSLESDFASSDAVNCEEQSKGKNTRKTRKLQSTGTELVQYGKDESFVSEKCEEVVEVSKSKRGRKRTKVKSKVSNEEDQTDVSLLEMTVTKESNKSAQNRRKSGRKSTSITDKGIESAVVNESADVEEIDWEPIEKAQIRGKQTKQHRKDNENDPTEIKDKKVKKAKKKMKSGVTSLPLESHSAEHQQTSVCDSSNTEDAGRINRKGDEKKQKGLPNESLSSTDSQNTACNKKNKEDSETEMKPGDLHHKESSLCTEPKTLASIFLKRKPVTPKPETEEQHPTMTGDSVLSFTVSSEVTLGDTTNKCSTSDLDSSPRKVKSAAEQEAANRAFKALFTGACSQKMLPTATVTEALPAPWPLVSHVIQEDEDVSHGVNFWSLPWPVGKYHKSDDFSQNLSLDGSLADFFGSTSLLPEDRVMFCGKRQEQEKQCLCDPLKLETVNTQQNFPETVTKKILLELALYYPGVPLKKLYKRYAAKLEKHRKSSVAVESKQVAAENTAPVSDGKSNPKPSGNSEEKYHLINRKKGKVKRKLSSDGGVFQEKKVARKSEKSPAVLPCESQGLLMDQSVNKSCKKRGREEENDQGQERGIKERRLSTRLQKKKACLESESIDHLEQVEVTSNRKKRRRTSDHQKEVKETSEPSIEQGNPSESDVPVASDKEKNSAEGFVNDTLWTDLFCPLHSTEVMANASAVSKLRSWLEEWKVKREKTLRKELQQQKRLLAKQNGKSTATSQASSHTLEWWDNDSDSDFQMSDNASDDSDTEGVGLNTAMFISGPTGVGKTAMVYACAEELGYKVFEVNSSSKRSGKHILSQLEEATQSHLVINSKGPIPQSSFAGLFNKPVNNSSSASGPLGAFLSANATESDTKTKKCKKGKKKQKVKEKKKDEAKGKGRSILKQPPEAVNDDTESCSSLSSKAASLILFEEVDVIFEEDKSFWMAVNSFMQNAKCPIILISRGSQVSCEGRYEQINLKPPSVNLLAAHLQLVTLTSNIFVNPEDLKSLVAQNNCDIRKSFLTLQFWSASGGGVKIPYKRPANMKNKGNVPDKHSKPQDVSAICNSNIDHGKTDITSSQDVLQIELPVTSGILNGDGEESMFLSLSDWQAIKNRGTRRSSRTTQRGSLRQTEDDNNSDSDFCDPKKKTLVCTDGTTDSIFEITDTNDSQAVSTVDKKAEESPQLPLMDSLLFESSYGLLNCVADPAVSSLSVLQNKKKPGDIIENCVQSSKLHLTHFTQGLDVNFVQANLSDLIPLFAGCSTSSAQTKRDSPQVEGSDAALPITKHVSVKSDNIFFDKSLFDDGMEESGNYVEHDSVMETNQTTEKESEHTKAGPVPSSQDSTDTGFSESQPREEIGKGGRGPGDAEGTEYSDEKGRKRVHKKPTNDERCCTKALDIFAQFAENLSFSDAFCPSLSVSNTQSTSAEFGWWDAAVKPGLTDEHVTVQDCSDWLARDTRASLRGAVEVANLESCHVRVNSLLKDLKQIENSTQDKITSTPMENEQYDFKILSEDLPRRDSNAVVRFDALTQTQKSSIASHRKLHSSLCSCIPALYHCDHRCVAGDYIPTFRSLCHSERLREAANIKRRFLHYLDLYSFPLSRSSMEALADNYMAQ